MPPGDAAADDQLLYRSCPDHPDAGSALSWDEQVPPLGQDATLLAVVPIPGTGTSLAVVGYPIATSAADPDTPPARPSPGVRPGLDHGLLLDHAQRRAWVDGREILLTFQEF